MAVRIRPLGGRRVWLRPGTSDVSVVREVLVEKLHLPEGDVDGRQFYAILDLGSNIGISMAHMAERFPDARIVGVELDGENARLAEKNLQPWRSRCELVHGAVWPRPGYVRYVRESGRESGHRVVRNARADPDLASARTFSMNALLDCVSKTPGEPIDYVKMDIEGAELEVLTESTSWAARVRAMKVEVHHPYDVGRCLRDLRRLGFEAQRDGHNTVVASRGERQLATTQDATAGLLDAT
jgi:FkbM family methyltransferase